MQRCEPSALALICSAHAELNNFPYSSSWTRSEESDPWRGILPLVGAAVAGIAAKSRAFVGSRTVAGIGVNEHLAILVSLLFA